MSDSVDWTFVDKIGHIRRIARVIGIEKTMANLRTEQGIDEVIGSDIAGAVQVWSLDSLRNKTVKYVALMLHKTLRVTVIRVRLTPL